MKTSQFIPSNLSSASEYALILGTGATAAVSLAAQQATIASLPLTALVAMGLLNRHRLDQQLKDEEPTAPVLTNPATFSSQETVTAQPVMTQPVPESLPVQPYPPALAPKARQTAPVSPTAEFETTGQTIDPLTALQQEKLYQIGAYLQQMRQAKGWSLQDVHSRTFIQVYMLNAVEMGHLHRLPEPFYVRAFIAKYGQALGLKGRQIASEFPLA